MWLTEKSLFIEGVGYLEQWALKDPYEDPYGLHWLDQLIL
jgi:hypothetical protein